MTKINKQIANNKNRINTLKTITKLFGYIPSYTFFSDDIKADIYDCFSLSDANPHQYQTVPLPTGVMFGNFKF